MTSSFPVATPLRGVFSRTFALSALCFALCSSDLFAQVGNNNPTGVAGIFNGQVNTGCSYDPYTGNATRSITDIAVAGAVGEYPLALVRSANSRAPSTTEVFGWAGGWNHNYNWILEDSPTSNTANFQPKRYTVVFPDGRVETFRAATWDTCYRVRPGVDTPPQSTSAGVRERFLQLNLNNMYAYLILPDGGAVEFRAQQHSANGRYYYKYHATGIYDPHGLKTTFQSEVTPNGLRRRLVWVIDPSGQRSLHFTYVGPNNAKIASIEASDGRVVNYNYIYCNGCRLDNVVYYNNANWTARYQYTGANIGLDLPPLLWTADDPMYPGPMKRIAYVYRTANNPDGTTPAYGQVQSENYYDGTTVGAPVSTLTVGESPNITYKRKETRGDSETRTFIYSGVGQINWASDFMGYNTQQHYDATTKYVDYVVDRNGHRTDYTSDPITGNVLQIQFPFTHEDTPNQSVRPTINYIYGGGAGCSDPNNQNPYWVCTATDEAGNQTQFTRDPVFYRATRIDYPDGGYETFTYDAAHFYRLSSHRMKTGGTETFAYDGLHRLQYYSDPYHSNPGNPSMQYFYDARDRVSGVVDSLSHSTNWDYNDRGQVTLTTLPWIDNTRYTIRNSYNPNGDGTLVSVTDQLNHITSYTYDDYRRLKSVALPARGDGTGTHTTSFYYGANAWDAVDDYKWTDSNVTWVVLHSGKKTKTLYDDNRRKTEVTVGWGTTNPATTSYGYDNAGNVTTVTNPRNRTVTTVYDERNRPSEVHDPYANVTSFTYDTAGRRKTITRPNGQVITNASFDAMNRVLQQNVTQTPDPLAVTKYTYYPSGLLNTMTDPHNSTDSYTYTYDLMGRKSWVTYPADSNGNHWTERFTYDAAGRLETFKNRKGNVQTLHYDALNRLTYFTWDDNLTPRVDFSYDAASRLTEIDNANATITRTYWDDNLLRAETEQITGGSPKTVIYFYNDDANRDSITYPDYQNFAYTYTPRNQLKTVGPWATYTYDENGYIGDLTTRTVNNGTQSTHLYDPLDRVTWITHSFTSGSRGFNYGYDDVSVGNRKYVRRTGTTLGDKGDVFSYDLADQTMGVGLNVTSPQSTPAPPRSIFYDANGNRTTFRPYGPIDTYALNNLNQYTSRNSNNATYDANGNMIVTPDPAGNRSTYAYDAQNRLLSAGKGSVTMYFTYDGLNRQVSRKIGANGTPAFNVWDGWDLIEEYQSSGTVTAKYVYGPTGLVKELVNNRYYYQDGSGSTSHVANASGQLQEWYRYDLQGAPFFYNASDTQLSASALGVRHLFTGQQWYSDLKLYDLRNRFYSPDLGRFLQPDPIGFWGGKNLYGYCGNNPVTRWDRFGLQDAVAPTLPEGWSATVEVFGSDVPEPIDPGGTGAPSGGGGGGGSGEGGRGSPKLSGITFSYGKPRRNNNSNTQQQPPGIMVGFDIYHPTTTAEFIIAGNIIEHGDTTDTIPAIDPIDILSGGTAALARSWVPTAVRKTAVFWAGGRVAEDAARTFAKANGGTILGDTAAARALAQSTANIPSWQARSQWLSLSQDFARSASGEVNVFQNARGVPLNTMWRSEYEILLENPNITGIRYWIVMPDGSVVPAP
jgi:RHS repeat-associated protein